MRFYELNEGISYRNGLDSFEFDFEHDNKTDIIKLTKSISVYKDLGPCTYFGYEFEQNADKDAKKKIIDYLKYSDDKDIKQLVVRAVNSLYEVVDLSEVKTIIYPESSSKLNQLIVKTIYHTCAGTLNSCELVKELPKNIDFDTYRKTAKDVEKLNVYRNLQNSKVLIIDDISTTYSTITFLLETVRAINKDCDIAVFCLVGNKE